MGDTLRPALGHFLSHRNRRRRMTRYDTAKRPAEKKPMGCITLFCVIVAALLFVFFLLPAGCTGLAIWGGSVVAEQEKAQQEQARAQAKAEADLDRALAAEARKASKKAPAVQPVGPPSEIAMALRARAKFPMEVTLVKDRRVAVAGVTFDFQSGRPLPILRMLDDGTLIARVAGNEVGIPFDETDFVQRVAP